MVRRTALKVVVVAAALLAFDPAQTASAEGLRFDCQYTAMTSRDGVQETSFSLQFVYDKITRDAILIGNQGFSAVETVLGAEAVTFLETLPNGVVQVTAIAHHDGSSVHSRHTLLPVPSGGVQFFPSQFFGTCEESHT